MVKEWELDARMNDLSLWKLFSTQCQNSRGTHTYNEDFRYMFLSYVTIGYNQQSFLKSILVGIGDYLTGVSSPVQDYKRILWLVSHL